MTEQREMPKYQCHKIVWALQIGSVHQTPGGAILVPEDATYAGIEVDQDYMDKHKPVPGGYYVVYKDGYKSFSPQKAFEEGYTPYQMKKLTLLALLPVVAMEDPHICDP